MYLHTQFADRELFACSVPPSCNDSLEDDFAELSRIHFYLGRTPIDFMIEAVEKTSLKDIEKGKIQIYFAVKEIQDFLSHAFDSVSKFGAESLNPEICFNKTFNNILDETGKVLDSAYKSPTKKHNVERIETMLGLAHEVKFFSETLKDIGLSITDLTDKFKDIEEKYQKILNLKGNYEKLDSLKSFDFYADGAKQSVMEQLSIPYDFNYAKLTDIYLDQGDWVRTLHHIREEQKDIDTNPDYKFNENASKELKEDFLTQIKSFNRLLKNGVVNYVLSFAAAISKEAAYTVLNSKVSAEDYFAREIGYHKKGLENIYSKKSYHQEHIAELNKNKAKYIKSKVDDKSFYEQVLTILSRQEQNILQSLDKVKNKIFNIQPKEALTFEGNINEGFVIGTFSNEDKIMVIHKDDTVNSPEAIYAKVFTKDSYQDLVKNNLLVFNEDFKQMNCISGANFFSYGQLLQELNSLKEHNDFLTQKVDLIDNAQIPISKKKKYK
jgi:hypothetical protein